MSKWPDTSETLILRTKDPADAEAWSVFLAIYRPVVFRLACSRGLQDADADDLAQRVFASIADAIGRWEPSPDSPPFRAWLYRIASNEITKVVSRLKPDRGAGTSSVQEQLNALPQPREEAATQLLHEARLEAFRWAAGEIQIEFKPATWSMFWESTVEGKAVEHVAKAHERTSGAVYLARYRVMRRLREKLDEVSDIWSMK